ncbi:MAG: ribbon-helix-helix domain-containing protein [Acidobacteria bacterium]|jgi:hypothetical protein|nr:ribbon-helix-helix domain-containing protein [Acidobacteriota bacterium]
MRRTTIFLPDELHEELRREAFRRNVSMAEVIRERLATPPEDAPTLRFTGRHPMEDVIGIASHGGLTENIDRDLYGI